MRIVNSCQFSFFIWIILGCGIFILVESQYYATWQSVLRLPFSLNKLNALMHEWLQTFKLCCCFFFILYIWFLNLMFDLHVQNQTFKFLQVTKTIQYFLWLGVFYIQIVSPSNSQNTARCPVTVYKQTVFGKHLIIFYEQLCYWALSLQNITNPLKTVWIEK